jgi:ComF family protein
MKFKMKNNKNILKYIVRKMSAHADALAELVYPSDIYCLCCGAETEPGRLYAMCDKCLSDINWANGKLCAACGKSLEDWYPDRFCNDCLSRERTFDAGVTCFQYKEAERDMIKQFKYHNKSYMARNLSEIMYDKVMAVSPKCDILIPVPMYKAKERKRGYNQADLLARFTAERLGTAYSSSVLERTRNTAPMNKLDAQDRKRNLDGAFKVTAEGTEQIAGKHVMLVDDIYTTGTTAEHCARVLKESGAASVTVLSLASGRNQRELPVVE